MLCGVLYLLSYSEAQPFVVHVNIKHIITKSLALGFMRPFKSSVISTRSLGDSFFLKYKFQCRLA